MRDEVNRTGTIDSLHPPLPGNPATPACPASKDRLEAPEHVVFLLRYDDEITYLVNEGLLRPGTQPSGLK